MGIIGCLLLMAGIWGFAEATFFFIIPDVILTLIAMHGLRRGMTACLIALFGAMLGGIVIYFAATYDFAVVYQFIVNVPGISNQMMTSVEESLQEQGVIAMVVGPIKGIPYKTFAMMVPVTDISFATFILATIPARFIRFIATSLLAWWLANIVFKKVPMWVKYIIWLLVWMLVYIIYFSIHPW